MKNSFLAMAFVFCACDSGETAVSEAEAAGVITGAFSSASAKLYDFTFDGELLTDSAFDPNAQIKNQLFYSIGQLNGQKDTVRSGGGVGRLDALVLSNVVVAADPSGLKRITYRAVLPVGWLDLYNTPKAFVFRLPRDVSSAGLARFTQLYATRCIDTFSAHDVTQYNFWYYYRPTARGCSIAAADVVDASASIALSAQNTNGKYPEYDLLWKDRTLNAVIIFGKDKVGASGFGDFGVSGYGLFNSRMPFAVPGVRMAPTTCANRPNASCAGMPGAPGVEFPDVTWSATFPDGRTINVTVMLIDAPTRTTTSFDARYAELTPTADLIIYNGHAALGENVRALTRKGRFVAGQYTIVSMMGCDSFAYVDGYMSQQRALLNPTDTFGTKHLDMITNLMPTNPTKLGPAAQVMLETLSDLQQPKTYEQILRRYEFDHYPVVTGDEDNTFAPQK